MPLIRRDKQESTVTKTVRIKDQSQFPLMKAYIQWSGISDDPEDKDALSFLLTESFMHMAAKDKDFVNYLKETYQITKDRNILEDAAAHILQHSPASANQLSGEGEDQDKA